MMVFRATCEVPLSNVSFSKKHAKVKTTLDDETERRKHFYGIDAGVKKSSKEGKKHSGDAGRTKDGKKSGTK